jgi:lambda repressor-like predicted transcriptional regulator
MHPADIQAELKKRGIRQCSIAEDLDVSAFHISAVINFGASRPSDRVMRYIARKIERDPYEVFPDYYFKKYRTRSVAT